MAAKSAGHSRLLLYIIHTAFEVADSTGSRNRLRFTSAVRVRVIP